MNSHLKWYRLNKLIDIYYWILIHQLFFMTQFYIRHCLLSPFNKELQSFLFPLEILNPLLSYRSTTFSSYLIFFYTLQSIWHLPLFCPYQYYNTFLLFFDQSFSKRSIFISSLIGRFLNKKMQTISGNASNLR